ncbi:MAG: hypothetical protein AAFV29_06710, partial [Myxococcota bacterium]
MRSSAILITAGLALWLPIHLVAALVWSLASTPETTALSLVDDVAIWPRPALRVIPYRGLSQPLPVPAYERSVSNEALNTASTLRPSWRLGM